MRVNPKIEIAIGRIVYHHELLVTPVKTVEVECEALAMGVLAIADCAGSQDDRGLVAVPNLKELFKALLQCVLQLRAAFERTAFSLASITKRSWEAIVVHRHVNQFLERSFVCRHLKALPADYKFTP